VTTPRTVTSRPRTPRGTPSTFWDNTPRTLPSVYSFITPRPPRPARPGGESESLSDNRHPAPAYSSYYEQPLPLTRVSFARDFEPASPIELPPPAQDFPERRMSMSSQHNWQTDSCDTFGPPLQSAPNLETPIRKHLRRASFAPEHEPPTPIELPPPMREPEDRRISTFSVENWTNPREASERRLSTQSGIHFQLFPPNVRHRAPSVTG
jgi:hypothetical protein